jgi:LysM repeat protein
MKKLLISLLIATISTTAIQAKRTNIKMSDYTVQSGDTLFTIARKHHTTTEEVRKSNGFEYGQLIRVGQVLRVPTNTYFPKEGIKQKKIAQKSQKPKKGMTKYAIKSGDTLFTIARKYHTTIKEVLEANGMERNSLIRIGQLLKVPTNTYFPEEIKKAKEKEIALKNRTKGQTEYTIEKGDTLFIVARKHHTTINEVLEANGMERNAMIRIGQVLKVPTNTYFPEDATKERVKIAKKEILDVPKGIYEVQGGDTLFSIAKKNHVTLKEIMALNDIKAGSVIKVGQKLKVSKKSTFIASKKKTKIVLKKYRVRRGDTLGKIARKYKISIKKLRKLNKLSRKSHLKKGTLLVVGEKKARKKMPSIYRVRKGDTIWLIAKRNHISVKKLRKYNGLTRKSKLRKGMILALKRKSKNKQVRARLAKVKAKIKKSKKTKTRVASKTKHTKSRRRSNALAIFNGKSRKSSRGSSQVIRTAKRYLGTRYVWGAEGPNRFDCSGFTQYVIRKSKGVKLPRVSRKQAYYGKYVSRGNLRPGDLIFFDTSRRRRGYVNHVGIYIGSNKFIHASSAKHRVVISSLNRPFYNARFKWGRRVN